MASDMCLLTSMESLYRTTAAADSPENTKGILSFSAEGAWLRMVCVTALTVES